MDFLELANKDVVVFGLANKKSVAYAIAKVLVEAGARLILVVRNEVRAESARKLFPQAAVFCCDILRRSSGAYRQRTAPKYRQRICVSDQQLRKER